VGNTEKAQRTAVARQRSNIYGLLASVYRQEVNADLLHQVKDPQFLGVLSDLGIQLTSDFLQKPEEELLDDLAVEFAGLFLGPGGHISPHESVHHQRDGVESGMLWGEATAEVKKFIESAGLDYDPEYTGLPDHISVELEFMEALARHEEQAWSEDDDEEAFRCLDMERRFLDEHLSRWVPAFCDKVMAAAELSFYRELAGLTKRFIEFDREEIEGYVGDFN
jgi:TorA maturation chaperone TorD